MSKSDATRGTTLAEVRTFALSLPETTEQPHFELSSFRVKGRIFATVPPDGDHLHVFVDEDRADAAIGHDPVAFEVLRWGKSRAGLRIRLALADPDVVFDLIEDAWRRKAPKGVVGRQGAGRLAARGGTRG